MPAPGVWEAVMKLLPPPPQKIMDLGAGEQLNIGNIMKIPGYEIHRCDIVDFLGVPNFKRCDLNKEFPYQTDEFDGVVAVEIIEHLENPRHFFRECSRIASKFVIVTSPNCCSPESKERFLKTGFFKYFDTGKPYGHITPIFPWMVRMICKELRLKLEVETYNNTQQEIYIARIKVEPT